MFKNLMTTAAVQEVDPTWSIPTLLAKTGPFPLEEVAGLLELTTATIKFEASQLDDSYQMGIARLWNSGRWIVQMELFAPYYLEHLKHRIRRVPERWDANDLLSKKGRYFLADVCRKIPFKPYHIKRQIKINGDIGVWKDSTTDNYVVDMSQFGPWLKQVWLSPEPLSTEVINVDPHFPP